MDINRELNNRKQSNKFVYFFENIFVLFIITIDIIN